MSKRRFELGDVVIHSTYGEGEIIGEGADTCAVKFKKPRKEFHSCNGLGTYGYCWWADVENLKLANELKFSKGDKVKVKLPFGKELIGIVLRSGSRGYTVVECDKDTEEIENKRLELIRRGFKVGDLIEVKDKIFDNMHIKKGMFARVICDRENSVGLEFFDNINGHTCNGRGTLGKCWFVAFTNLFNSELLDKDYISQMNRNPKERLLIKRIDDKTIRGEITADSDIGVTISKAEVKCNPSDAFDYKTALELLGERLEKNRITIDEVIEKEYLIYIENKYDLHKFVEFTKKRNIKWQSGREFDIDDSTADFYLKNNGFIKFSISRSGYLNYSHTLEYDRRSTIDIKSIKF